MVRVSQKKNGFTLCNPFELNDIGNDNDNYNDDGNGNGNGNGNVNGNGNSSGSRIKNEKENRKTAIASKLMIEHVLT